jgi:hypothetical protein
MVCSTNIRNTRILYALRRGMLMTFHDCLISVLRSERG